MKYIITGSTGHISKPLSELLIKASQDVTIISSKSGKIKEIEGLGAKPSIGSVDDISFLTKAFVGADAVYTMVPPKMDVVNYKEYIHGIGKNYAKAIQAAGVKKVVNLSSVGAHMAEGCGPVSGLYFVEQELNSLAGVDVMHLRPVSFYYNLLGNIAMIKNMGIIGSNYSDIILPMIHPADIAVAAFEELSALAFKGKNIRYIAGDERSTGDIAKVLGEAIGKPDLKWVRFKDEDALNGILKAGIPKNVAENFVEMGQAIASGEMVSDFNKHKPSISKIKLEDFAREFAAVYASS